jgi:hypothetical protein
MLEHAIRASKVGPVFPLVPMSKGQPMLGNWPQLATRDEAIIRQQWGPTGTPTANIGLHCAGLCVVDVDIKKGGNESFQRLDLMFGFPATLVTRTASGGQHVFFRLPEGHPGVPNSVAELAPGLDIRSTGGYVVAPGSVVAGGTYTFVDPAAQIALAPDWLVQRLGVQHGVGSAAHHDVGGVSDAPDGSVERARQWLAGAERSVKGQGGDQAAFRVACKLRDLGMSYHQACELMRDEAWDYGCGWREGRLEDKPIRSAYTYAQNEGGGSRGVVEDDLPLPSAMPDLGTIMPKMGMKKRGKLVRADEYASEEGRGPGYVVKNLFQRASYVVAFGPPGAGKSFLLDDVGYHVANSKPWMGMLVRGGPVLALIFEGYGGKKKRMRALQKKYGDDLGPLYLVNATMNLREQAGRQELGAIMAEMPEKPALIIIDTFARALMGGDENSAQDVGALNDAIAKLIDNTGACVILVHHSGKNKAAGARGSSAILGAIDTEVEIDFGMLKPTKQRDLEILPPIPFKLRPVVVGIDEDGDDEKSCVVEACKAGPMRQDLKGDYALAFMALGDLCGESNEPVSVHNWRRKLTDEGILPTEPRKQQKRFYEIRNRMEKAGHIAIEDDQVKRGMR